MEGLHIMLITDKQLKRQAMMLMSLSNSEKTISIKGAAMSLDVTTKTIIRDLEELITKIPSNIGYKMDYNYGLEFICDDIFQLEQIIFALVEKSLLYQMLDGIFNGEIIRASEWAERFFMSRTTFRKHIHYLNSEVLHKYGIKVGQQFLKLIGDEKIIRFFYFELFFKFRNQLKTDRIGKKYFDIYHAMANSQLKPLSNLSLDCQRMAGWLFISLQRTLRGCEIKLTKSLISETVNRDNFIIFRDELLINIRRHFFNLQLKESEIVFLYQVTLYAVVYSKEDVQADYLRRFSPKIYLLDSLLSDALFKIFNDKQIVSKAIERHRALVCNTYHLSKVSKVFQKVSKDVAYFIQSEYFHVYNIWREALRKSELISRYGIVHVDDLAVSLTMISKSYFQELELNRGRVLISFSGEPGHVGYLTAFCKKLIPHGCEVIVKYSEIIRKQYLIQNKFDLFICNYTISESMPCPTFRLSYIPSDLEWAKLKVALLGLNKSYIKV